ncbi:MAG: hypothetical protein H0T47_17830 [Planctomycetaceae bacterium]|nr:hypothetical protein [Planctomycetaceae bacterium]
MQKFLLGYGDGATGKSSTNAGIHAILGRENVSAVPLERFGDRFALYGMHGKLANIASEIGAIDKAAEGHLKALTSGDLFEFERKHKDPFYAVPTARLIFATNNLPRFSDRSGGLWRRMILMPFTEVIPEDERIPGMDRPEFWEASGELPGMLNWALIGLKRLQAQGRFTESSVVSAMVDDYRRDSNPAQTFLLDHYREHEHGQESKSEVCCQIRFQAHDSMIPIIREKNHGKPDPTKLSNAEAARTGDRVHPRSRDPGCLGCAA